MHTISCRLLFLKLKQFLPSIIIYGSPYLFDLLTRSRARSGIQLRSKIDLNDMKVFNIKK